MDTALSDLEFHLLNDWQRDLPLSERPYAAMAEKLSCTEAEVIAGLGDLMARGHISRVGAVFRPHAPCCLMMEASTGSRRISTRRARAMSSAVINGATP